MPEQESAVVLVRVPEVKEAAVAVPMENQNDRKSIQA